MSDASTLLICALDESSLGYAIDISRNLRQHGIANEVYPGAAKLKKQLDYANAKGFAFAAIIGSTEKEENKVSLKNMITGDQELINATEIFNKVTNE